MLGTSSSVVALAKKMAKPETKTVTRTVAAPKTKIVTQATTAADDTKRHRTNRLHTYSSTASVTKSTRRQRKTLKTAQKCTVCSCLTVVVDTMTDWHSETLCKYFCHNTTVQKRRKNVLVHPITNL